MRYALAEAYKATRAVRPNPRVGCALESTSGELVTAHHERVGEFHAERRVLDLCKEKGVDTRGARVAVTLEPCSHQGRTPPCADALIAAGVSEVFVGVLDPNPLVNGKGLRKLEEAGIRVKTGVLEQKCEALNREWLWAHRSGRAHLTLKMATSWDGAWRSHTGASKWITSEEARLRAQQLRRRVDAIATSGATVREDNPKLTAREVDGSACVVQPKVFVLSEKPFDLSQFELGRHPAGVPEFVSSATAPQDFLKQCYINGLFDVMIEAGPKMAQAFLEAGVVDEIWSFQESQFLGGGESLRFPVPFAGGGLPGLRYEIREVEQLGPTSILSVLGPLRE
jgi:diaminohydroxyphosphoribosylaminopyrimidine deaminase/5-amino-6-(5-phosphoribosylamino)uracil reductase